MDKKTCAIPPNTAEYRFHQHAKFFNDGLRFVSRFRYFATADTAKSVAMYLQQNLLRPIQHISDRTVSFRYINGAHVIYVGSKHSTQHMLIYNQTNKNFAIDGVVWNKNNIGSELVFNACIYILDTYFGNDLVPAPAPAPAPAPRPGPGPRPTAVSAYEFMLQNEHTR